LRNCPPQALTCASDREIARRQAIAARLFAQARLCDQNHAMDMRYARSVLPEVQ